MQGRGSKRSRKEVTYFISGPDRQESFVNIHDYATHEDTEYYPAGQLGKGSYGAVRLFSSRDGKKIAVKSLLEKAVPLPNSKSVKAEANKADMEYILYNQAEPDDDVSMILHHNKTHTIKGRNGKSRRIHLHSYRRVMRFAKGIEFKHFCAQKIHHTHELVALFMKTAEELKRIHDNGVIHGDVSSRNILVDESCAEYTVTFIDFGLSYFSNGHADVGYLKERDGNATYSMAPERFDQNIIPADASQDIHSLAVTFERAIAEQGTEWKTYFLQKYAFIRDFITSGKNEDATQRPKLTDFISNARAALQWEDALSHPEKLLLAALRTNKRANIQRATIALRHNQITFIITLIKHREYTCLINLINANQNIDLSPLSMHLDICKNRYDQSGNTIAHLAVQQNCAPLLATLLQLNPDLTLVNKDNQTAPEIAQTAEAIALLELSSYKQQVASSTLPPPSFFGKTPTAKRKATIGAANLLEQMIVSGVTPEGAQEYIDVILGDEALSRIYTDLTTNKIIPHIKQPSRSCYDIVKESIFGRA
jgi:serine/threonine protein kinase